MSQRVAEGVCACFQGFVCMNLFPQKWSVYLTRPIGGGHGLPGCKVYEVSKIGQADLRLRGVLESIPTGSVGVSPPMGEPILFTGSTLREKGCERSNRVETSLNSKLVPSNAS